MTFASFAGMCLAVLMAMTFQGACKSSGGSKEPLPPPTGPTMDADPNASAALSAIDPLAELPPSKGQWRKIDAEGAPRPCLMGASKIFWADGKLLVFGTTNGSVSDGQCRAKGFIYDSAAATWKAMADDPYTSIGSSLFALRKAFFYEGKLYILSQIKDPVESRVYDVAKDSWDTAPAWARDLTFEQVATPVATADGSTLENVSEGFVPFRQQNDSMIAFRSAGVTITQLKTQTGKALANEAMLGDVDPKLGKIVDKGFAASDTHVIQYGSIEKSLLFATHSQTTATGNWKAVEVKSSCQNPMASLTLGLTRNFVALQIDPLIKFDKGPPKVTDNWNLCASVTDPDTADVVHPVQTVIRRAQHRSDVFEYCYYEPIQGVANGDRAIYELSRLAGLTPTDASTKKIDNSGNDRRFLVLDGGQGVFSLTSSAPGLERNHSLMISIPNGFVVWGGDLPGEKSKFSFFSDGAIYTFD